jgi:hypothetical protein
MYSTNGYDWVNASGPPGKYIFGKYNIYPKGDILYSNGLFLATARGSGVIWTSVDGKKWTSPFTFAASDYGNEIVYIPDKKRYVTVGYSNGTANIWYSSVRDTWSKAKTSFVKKGNETPYGSAVAYAPDKKLLVATGFGIKKILSSADGITWS